MSGICIQEFVGKDARCKTLRLSCHGLCRRAYPNVQNLFGELGIDDRLQVRQGFVALHGRVFVLFDACIKSSISASTIMIVASSGPPRAVEGAQHDLCLAGHSRAVQPL